MKKASLLDAAVRFFSDDEDPNEPVYDPVQLGGTIVLTISGMGAIYWLLWTLLVFEGGIFLKAQAFAQVLFTSRTLKDLGYEGYPYAMGPFEGWYGSVGALLLLALTAAAMRRIFQRFARARRK